MTFKCQGKWALIMLAVLLLPVRMLFAQADQGTITGVVQDSSGAVIGNANVTLTNVDLGQVLKSKTDSSGIFVFSPVKIGNYKVSATANGFQTTTQENLHLSLQQRLNVPITLKPGAASETITVTTDVPLMQTQESSVGQVMDTQTIDSVPLNGRNWVYIAQLAAGAVPPEGSRGQGKGDFNANGQRAEENNFILDGVDNNATVVDFYNGASFVVQPPPDALAEFKVQTSDYSAEFGHSAGAVVNASIKSGTNNIHGSAWEYLRNTIFDTYNWNQSQLKTSGAGVPAYHENQFGATLGGPILKNKLFLFADAQANRITFGESSTMSVPTAKMRTGDFSELLNTNLTDAAAPIQLYQQTSSAPPSPYAGNIIPSSQINATAMKMLNYYPAPNTNGGKTHDNYLSTRPVKDNTFTWDARVDYTIGAKDTAYSRFSYGNEMGYNTPPLGTILDGGGFGDDGKQKNLGENFMFSETHVFTDTLTNEFRVAYNYLHTGFQHPNAANLNFASSVGFGGIPTATLNGGLPRVSIGGISDFGSPTWSTTDEHENVYQILDNVTKIAGKHSLKAGVSFQSIRFSTLQPQQSRGSYNYNGKYTSNLNASNTGYGVADFLLDMQNSAGLSNEVTTGDARWNDGVYFQDDWRVRQDLTLNLGLRWEYFQPYKEVGGSQASYDMTGTPSLNTTTGRGSGKAEYLIPQMSETRAKSIMDHTWNTGNANYNSYSSLLAYDNVNVLYLPNPSLVDAQKTNFAPRVGLAWSPDTKTVVRAGYGIFYGGLESTGYWPNLSENYPFQYTGSFPSASCGTNNCPTDGITIANGFASIIANGFASNITNLTMRGSDPKAKTPYTTSYNLSIQRSLTNELGATVSYVGNQSRHLQVFPDPNNPLALMNTNNSSQPTRPLPEVGGTSYTSYTGLSNYNSLQTKLEKRMSNGYNFLATYTWSHSLDDAPTPLGTTGDWGYRQDRLIPQIMDYSNSGFDTRHRFTFNGLYQLPFGVGRRFANQNRVADLVIGGWSANATFFAQSGNPFTVGPSGVTGGNNGGRRAIKKGDPFSTGGSCNNSVSPAITSIRNRAHWYNPCAFANPWEGNDPVNNLAHYIPKNATDKANTGAPTPVYVTDTASVIGYLGGRRTQIYGPGYERVNMSIFKNFKTFREQTFEFRADIFNVLNTPSLGQPSGTGLDSNAGHITDPRNLQRYAPDSRFIQLGLKYEF